MLFSHTCLSEKQCYSQLFDFAFSVGMSVFVLVCMTPPTSNLSNGISTDRVASWWKSQRSAMAWKPENEPSQRSTRPKPRHPSKFLYDQRNIKRRSEAHRLPLSFALVPVACPQSGNPRECRVWGGGGQRNNSLQYIEFGLQWLFNL